MIDVRALESDQINPETGKTFHQEYLEALENRGGDTTLLDKVLELNRERKRLTVESETKKAEQNRIGQTIAQKKRGGQDASAELELTQQISSQLKESANQLSELEAKLHDLALRLPNKLHSSVPVGRSDADNVVVRTWGEPRKFAFKPKEHWEIGEKLGVLDFERAAKVTGARFAFLKKGLARLERAVASFMMDLHSEQHGYTEMWPPFIVNSDSLTGTGQLPKFGEELFKLEGSNYYLVPTAEVPLTNYFRDEMLAEADLPHKFVGFSPCFRAEAGSYGKDTKGLIRQHQFDKVELMRIAHPDTSYDEHEELTRHAEEVLRRLELPYQVMLLCSGDISAGAAKCYDLNVWLPGQGVYREISSCSNFEDYQARRAGIRFRPAGGGKPRFVHTLNGSGLAVGRTVIAILENYQQEDGSVVIPKALHPYMSGLTRLENR